MNILIIQGNPDRESFCYRNAMNYYQVASQKNNNVKIIDLSNADFDPVLRYGYRKHMENEEFPNHVQHLIKESDHLVFFFPVWWSAEPSVLKGLIDRVLTPRFCYKYDGNKVIKLLKGKTAEMFITSHASSLFYNSIGGIIFRWKYMILNFCGIKLVNHAIMGKMETKKDTPERRKAFINKCVKRFNK